MIERSNYISKVNREKIYHWFLNITKRLSERQMLAILAVIVGALAGLGTYLFEVLLHFIKSCLVNWFDVDTFHILYLIYPGIGIVLATLFVKYIVKDNISEGVTRVLYAMSSRGSRIAGHNCWTSVVGGATTIGFGGSVGPEAPIVLTGAAIGSNVGKLAKLNYRNITLLLCCGAGAAVAAIGIAKWKTATLMIGIALTLFYNLPFELLNLRISDFLLALAAISIFLVKKRKEQR